MDIIQVDPAWAWTSYQPSVDTPWDRQAAAHLYRRAGFGATSQQLDAAITTEPTVLAHRLVHERSESDSFRKLIRGMTDSMIATGNAARLASAWLYRMLQTPDQLQEKATLFWHGHFATSADKVQDPIMMQQQNDLLRAHATGNFRQLVQEISRDAAMLVYLDSASNRKTHPNENYAREVMELFCLGEGHYSEQDIRELARCFTGWEVKNRRFRFNRYQHDFGSKTILGKTAEFTGEQAVEQVLSQPVAARFIAAKLVNFFVFDEPAVPAVLVQPLADQLEQDDFQLATTLTRILSSNLFYSSLSRRRKIRSPVELMVGMIRTLEMTVNVNQLTDGIREIGQGLLYPPNVKGWDGGRSWVNSSTLLGRTNLVYLVLSDEKTRFAGGSLQQFLASQGVDDLEQAVNWFVDHLLAVDLEPSRRAQLAAAAEADSDESYLQLLHALSTLPEFQIS
jgi:uncharacterized protein (DUF1800 family)